MVGCDSMLAFGDVIWGKPGTVEVARARWREMAGRTGVLHTGHSVIRVHNGVPTHEETRTAATSVRFAIPHPGISTPIWPAANLSRWRALSLWTAWEAGSSTASTATRRTSSGSASHCFAACSAVRVLPYPTSGGPLGRLGTCRYPQIPVPP